MGAGLWEGVAGVAGEVLWCVSSMDWEWCRGVTLGAPEGEIYVTQGWIDDKALR